MQLTISADHALVLKTDGLWGLPEGRASAYLGALFHAKYETYELGKLPLARTQSREGLSEK